MIDTTVPYEYYATIMDVHDGDTVKLNIVLADVDLGFNVHIKIYKPDDDDSFRLAGINAPELKTAAGPVARDYLKTILAPHTEGGTTPAIPLKVWTIKDKKEKFGRYLAFLQLPDGTVVNDVMQTSGHAIPFMQDRAMRPTELGPYPTVQS